MKHQTARYIPENSTAIEKYNAVVYIFTNKNNQPAAIAYIGKQSKPFFFYRFINDEQRSKRVSDFFASMKRTQEFKQERQAARKSFTHTLQIGDILYSSWGYDQTNIEYYQVVSKTEKTVTFCEVAQNRTTTSWMAGTCSPIKDQFIGKEYTRPVRQGNTVHFAEYEGGYMRHLWQWDGKEKGYSEYA